MEVQTIKKPDGQDQASYIQNEMEMNMHKILTEIELQRKIYLFQKAVEEHAEKRSRPTAQSVAKAKTELALFVMRGGA